jgi:two-component system response regulator AtoC
MPTPNANLLIVDDDATLLDALDMVLGDQFKIFSCLSAENALEELEKRPFSIALCDVHLSGLSGEALLATIKTNWPGTEVIMITGGKDLQTAVRCMRLGAYDYIAKPLDIEDLKAVVKRASEKSELVRENAMLKQGAWVPPPADLLGQSPPMQALRQLLAKVAVHDNVVLLSGESGTGKEMAARAIHNQSARRRERFVAIGCGSVPAELVESELFGHERGAFSSAYATRIGKFEYASGGTLLLDDVAALPLGVQAKLLRVLQEREVCRLGSNRVIPVDVRVISSSNVDLPDLVRRGLFREDLYWRISGIPIQLPPLRDREGDSVELFRHFLGEVAARYGAKTPTISDSVERAIRSHAFPGNIRELKHLVETLFVLRDGDMIDVSALPVQMILRSEGKPLERLPLKDAVREFERQAIHRALRSTQGNQSRAAELLGIHRNTLLVKMAEHGLGRRPSGEGEALTPSELPAPDPALTSGQLP